MAFPLAVEQLTHSVVAFVVVVSSCKASAVVRDSELLVLVVVVQAGNTSEVVLPYVGAYLAWPLHFVEGQQTGQEEV